MVARRPRKSQFYEYEFRRVKEVVGKTLPPSIMVILIATSMMGVSHLCGTGPRVILNATSRSRTCKEPERYTGKRLWLWIGLVKESQAPLVCLS